MASTNMKQTDPTAWLEEYRGKDFTGSWPTMKEMFDLTVKRYPNNNCLTDFDGPNGSRRTLNYVQAKEKITKLAAWLAANGVKYGDRVAVSGKNSPEWAVVYIAAFYAGAVICPMDYGLHNEEIENLLKQNSGKTVYYAMSYWLPKNGDREKAKCAGVSAKGGFQFLEKALAEEMGGYDERIKYWGMEALEWGNRLQNHNVALVWLSDRNRIFHKWHPNAETGFLRPYTAEYDSMHSFCENNFNPVLDQDFGKILTQEERPIIKYLEKEKPFIRQFNSNELECFLVLDEILKTKEHPFVKLCLSPRIKKGMLNIKPSFLKKLSKPFRFLTGTELLPIVNKNFEFLYSSFLPVLEKANLHDYYITQDLESVYLLWK